MKKFNLVKEIIVVDSNKLLQAVNSKKRFAITHKGDIKYAPFDSKDIFIFQSSDDTKPISSTSLGTIDYTALFGNTYQIVEDGERILIKAAGAWKNIIEINIENAEYDDTSSDGIAEFSDKKLEERGIEISLTHEAKKMIAEAGFDPVFGARPLKRAIAEIIEDRLADMILEGEVKEGDSVLFDMKGKEIKAEVK